MASKLSSLAFRLFGNKVVGRTSTKPNSGAVVSLWKRFFEVQQEEDEEKVAHLATILKENFDRHEVTSDDMTRTRMDFVKSCTFSLTGRYQDQRLTMMEQRQQRNQAPQVTTHRNGVLDAHPDESYLTLPQ